MACSCHVGPGGRGRGVKPGRVDGRRGGPKPKPLNSTIVGTGLPAAGVVTLACTSTVMDGVAVLSTWPIIVRVTVATPATVPGVVAVTVQVIGGTLAGMRPYTSRSNSSAISARRAGHCAAVVTGVPSARLSTSGIDAAYRLAWASSNVAGSLGLGPERMARTPNWSIMFWWSSNAGAAARAAAVAVRAANRAKAAGRGMRRCIVAPQLGGRIDGPRASTGGGQECLPY